jgi:phenylalanyl-tRNA synthetase beta chain
MCGLRNSQSWLEETEGSYDFFDLKGVLEHFLSALHIEGIEWKKSRELPCHPGRCVQILVNGKELGFSGELHPKICSAFELPEQAVCIAELDLDLIINYLMYMKVNRWKKESAVWHIRSLFRQTTGH